MHELTSCDKITTALQKHSNMVYRICFMYLKNKEEAEDAFQDIFLKYIQADIVFENEEHEKAWLCRVSFNRCKDILKSFRFKIASLENVPEPSYETSEEGDVLEAVLKLPTKYKDAIYLHYYEGYSPSQIAKFLRCSENTVYSHLSRGRKMLKERLGDDFEN